MALDEVNTGFTCISCIIFLFTFLTTGVGITTTGKSNCYFILETPLIVVALILMVLSLILAISSCFNRKNEDEQLFCCSVFLFVLIVPLSWTYGIISLYQAGITHKGKGLELPDRAYDEYQLHAYSKPLRKLVTNSHNWGKVHKCLIRSNACKRLTHNRANATFLEFSTKELSPIESGCCKPSYFCNFTYVTPTNWSTTPNTLFANSDCNAWSNDPRILCYNCEACKAGVLQVFKWKWKDVFKLRL